jgi:hypothetical protein
MQNKRETEGTITFDASGKRFNIHYDPFRNQLQVIENCIGDQSSLLGSNGEVRYWNKVHFIGRQEVVFFEGKNYSRTVPGIRKILPFGVAARQGIFRLCPPLPANLCWLLEKKSSCRSSGNDLLRSSGGISGFTAEMLQPRGVMEGSDLFLEGGRMSLQKEGEEVCYLDIEAILA